ncbi:hypothetical protein IJT10_09100 [bacterium]|nr:hypothetical protein [bacterium]
MYFEDDTPNSTYTDVIMDELYHDSVPQGTLFHKRTSPLPIRVRAGSIYEEGLSYESARESGRIKWPEVRYVALGLIKERVEQNSSNYLMQRVVEGMKKGGASSGKDEGKIVSYKSTYLLDIYLHDHSELLRFDSSFVNYRSFLKERTAHVSFQNFFRLVHDICIRCKGAEFTASVAPFLLWQRDKVRDYVSIYDYENEVFLNISRHEHLTKYVDLDFSRDSWAEGW